MPRVCVMAAGEIERRLLYDANCGFCRRWCDWAKRRGAEASMIFMDCRSSAELRRQARVTEQECEHTAVLIERSNDQLVAVHRGAAAINGVLATLPGRRNRWLRTLGA